MLYAFIGAIGLNVIGFLEGLGVEIYCARLTSSVLPLHALISVTVAYNVSRAATWFLFGCDSLLFFGAFLATFTLAKASSADDQHRLSVAHGYLGLAISLLFLFLFFFELIAASAGLWAGGVGATFSVFYLILMLILMPIWVRADFSTSKVGAKHYFFLFSS